MIKLNNLLNEKLKSKEEVYSKLHSLENNPDALQKYIESEIIPYHEPNDKTSSSKYVKGEIEILKNPKASTSRKNKSKENIKIIATNVLNYNLEKTAEKRALKMGWPARFGKSREKANPSNMKSKDELISKVNSLTGEKFEEYVIKEIIPYLHDRDVLILNTLFINSTKVGNETNNYESFLKKMVKDKIQSAFKSNDISTKKSTNSPSSNKQINFGKFERLDGITHSTDVSDLIDSNENIFSKEDKNKLYSLQSNLEQAEEDDNDDAVDSTILSIYSILKNYMAEAKGNISISKLLNNLLNEETFTATNKKTGKTSVFGSKDSRDSAIKAGTHSKADGKGGDVSKKTSKPTTNIFNTPTEEPKADTPTSEPKKKRPGNPSVNKDAKKKAEEYGITPQKLGNDEYKKAMFQAAVEALTDANFHDEARELISKIEGNPEWAKRVDYPKMDDPKYKEKMADIRTNGVDSSEYWGGEDGTHEFARKVAASSGWDGVDAADGIAFTLRMNGFHKEADKIQSVFDNKPYMKNEGRISLTKMVKEGKFKEDDLVYNKRTKTVGIVRMGDDKYGEVKTDADGNVNVDELEKYNPIKNKHQQNAKVAPSTEKEVNSRGLFNPFKSESIKLGKLLEISSIDGLNDILNGQSSQIEGIKISRGMAEHIIEWMRTSPYGKKYNSWVKKNSISTILPIAFNWGLERGLASELKSEFTALKSKYGKAVKKENTK